MFRELPNVINARRATVISSVWALLDQAALAAGIFCLNVVVARGISPHEYGSYALFNGTLILTVTIISALLSYPLTLFGAKASDHEYHETLRVSLALSCLASMVALPVMALLAHLLSMWSVFPLAVAIMCLRSFQAIQRSGFVCRMQFDQVLVGDLILSVTPTVLVVLALYFGALSVEAVFGSLFVAVVASVTLQFASQRVLPARPGFALSKAPGYWSVGRWAALNKYLTTGASLQLFPWALGMAHGPSSVASFQAVSNVSGVLAPIANGMSVQLLPTVVRKGKEGGSKVSVRYGAFGLLLMLPIMLLMALFPKQILSLAYGYNSPYIAAEGYIILFVGLMVLRYVSTILATLLQGIGLAKEASHGALISFLVGCIVVAPFVIYGAVAGAIWGLISLVGIRILLNWRSARHALYPRSEP